MNLLIPLILAILAPFIWGFMNTLDKFVVSHRVKNPLSFSIVAGLVNLGIGLILALFLNWSGITFNDIIFPALAGIIFGSQFFLYYYMLSKEDVSNVIGLIYLYPVLVAILSFLFLNVKLSLISYIGMFLILFGVIMLSVRMAKLKMKIAIWMIIMMILIVAFYEFFIKVATINIPAMNGLSISHIFVGLIIMLGLFHTKTRKGVSKELKNTKWSILIESFTFLGMLTTYFAMASLPATLVSSIAAMQPMAVLFIERIFNRFGGNISKDESFLPKLIPITLIVFGIILMYSQEIISLF